jgi:hypothetical protein
VKSSSTDLLLDGMQEVPEVGAGFIGTFAGAEGQQALVDIDGSRLRVPKVGQSWPIIGDAVRLIRVDRVMLMLGPVVARSTVGRVTATGAPRCTVEYPAGSGVSQLMGYPKGTTPVVGDVAVIDWASGGTVVALVTQAAGISAPTDPTPPAGPQRGRQVFTALDSGQYAKGGGLQSNDVYASTSTRSLWVYGTKIADTIPDGAAITSISINVSPLRNEGNAPRFGTHGNASMPGSSPTIANLTSLANASGWVALPTSFGDLLKTGGALGIGTDGAGYAIFRGTQKDGQSGALDIAWTA